MTNNNAMEVVEDCVLKHNLKKGENTEYLDKAVRNLYNHLMQYDQNLVTLKV